MKTKGTGMVVISNIVICGSTPTFLSAGEKCVMFHCFCVSLEKHLSNLRVNCAGIYIQSRLCFFFTF